MEPKIGHQIIRFDNLLDDERMRMRDSRIMVSMLGLDEVIEDNAHANASDGVT